jgi:hypothetical protein
MTRNNQKEINPSLNFKQKKLRKILREGTAYRTAVAHKRHREGIYNWHSQKDLCLLFTIGFATKEGEMKFWYI